MASLSRASSGRSPPPGDSSRHLGTNGERTDLMKRSIYTGGVLALISCAAVTSLAQAEEEPRLSYFEVPVRAVSGAFELAIENHYSQGVGLAAQGVRATDLTREGIGFGLMAGYRVSPMVLLGLGVRFDQFAPGEELADSSSDHGLVVGPTIDIEGAGTQVVAEKRPEVFFEAGLQAASDSLVRSAPRGLPAPSSPSHVRADKHLSRHAERVCFRPDARAPLGFATACRGHRCRPTYGRNVSGCRRDVARSRRTAPAFQFRNDAFRQIACLQVGQVF